MKRLFFTAAVFLIGAAPFVSAQAFAGTDRVNVVVVHTAQQAPRQEIAQMHRYDNASGPVYRDGRENRHAPVQGYQERAHPGYNDHRPEVQRANSRWQRNEHASYRSDRDRDGVPDRWDRRPYDPTRR